MPAEFLPCRIEGDKFQDYVLTLVRQWDANAVQIPGRFSFYDIFLPNLEVKVETKFDYRSKSVGVGGKHNVAIEYLGNKGQDSGITITKADKWCHGFWHPTLNKWVLGFFNVAELREFCKQYPTRPSREGAMNYLIPVEDLLTLKHKLFDYSYEEHGQN